MKKRGEILIINLIIVGEMKLYLTDLPYESGIC